MPTTRDFEPIKGIIHGQVPSKSNSYKIAVRDGHYTLVKGNALREYERTFHLQCRCRGAMLSRRFGLEVAVFYGSARLDLDNSLKIILDCLQVCKVIKNDNLCDEIHALKFVDKADPRIEFTITPLL